MHKELYLKAEGVQHLGLGPGAHGRPGRAGAGAAAGQG